MRTSQLAMAAVAAVAVIAIVPHGNRAAQAQRPAAKAKVPAGTSAAPLPFAAISTYVAPDGQTVFALSLPPVKDPPAGQPLDLVVLFDTSASQAGDFRTKALAALEALLAGLGPDDQAALIAVDIDPVPLTAGLVRPDGTEMTRALDQLRRRVPLGSTDMAAAIEAAVEAYAQAASGAKQSKASAGKAAAARPKAKPAGAKSSAAKPKIATRRNRAIVYLGDGLSKARLIPAAKMEQLVTMLAAAGASVSGYAIGPNLDAELLAALANHTGGFLAIDNDDLTGEQVGFFLADAARGTVIWPVSLNVPEALAEIFPKRTPPLRFDRDTILLGKLKKQDSSTAPETATAGQLIVSIEAKVAGQPVKLAWQVEMDEPSDEHAYVADLVDSAARDGGIFLPTLGSAGLAELRRLAVGRARDLARLGQQALVTGNVVEAARLAAEAVRLDPLNEDAHSLQSAVEKARQTGTDRAPRKLKLAD